MLEGVAGGSPWSWPINLKTLGKRWVWHNDLNSPTQKLYTCRGSMVTVPRRPRLHSIHLKAPDFGPSRDEVTGGQAHEKMENPYSCRGKVARQPPLPSHTPSFPKVG